jgi:hypothetical protein
MRHEQPETLFLIRVQGSGLGFCPQVSGVSVGREVAVDYLVGAYGHVVLGEKQVSFDLGNDLFGNARVGGDLRNVCRPGSDRGVSTFFFGTGGFYISSAGPAARARADGLNRSGRISIRL